MHDVRLQGYRTCGLSVTRIISYLLLLFFLVHFCFLANNLGLRQIPTLDAPPLLWFFFFRMFPPHSVFVSVTMKIKDVFEASWLDGYLYWWEIRIIEFTSFNEEWIEWHTSLFVYLSVCASNHNLWTPLTILIWKLVEP